MGLLCALFGHRRRADKAWHDTLDWRSTCSRCGTPLLRDHKIDRWRPFTATDHSASRKGQNEVV